MMSIPEASVEYVVADITSPSPVDSGWPVSMAIIPKHQKAPAAGDWVNAEWEGNGIRLLVGPGTAKVLTCGDYTVWVRINATPENAVRLAGGLEVT